jgi:hypothetical protein
VTGCGLRPQRGVDFGQDSRFAKAAFADNSNHSQFVARVEDGMADCGHFVLAADQKARSACGSKQACHGCLAGD